MKENQSKPEFDSTDDGEVEGRFSEAQVELLYDHILQTAEEAEMPSVSDVDRLEQKYELAREEIRELEKNGALDIWAHPPPALVEFLIEITGTSEDPHTVWRTDALALLTFYVRFHSLAFDIQSRIDSASMAEIRCVLASFVAAERICTGAHITAVERDKVGPAIRRAVSLLQRAEAPTLKR